MHALGDFSYRNVVVCRNGLWKGKCNMIPIRAGSLAYAYALRDPSNNKVIARELLYTNRHIHFHGCTGIYYFLSVP